MAREILFDIDKVSTIQLTKEKLTDKVWQDEIPPKPIYLFGFIPVGLSVLIPAGWRSDDYKWNISTEEDLSGCFWYRLDMETKKVYEKANVKVYLGYKETHTQSFDSDEEAADWVHELNELAGKNFVSIIYK